MTILPENFKFINSEIGLGRVMGNLDLYRSLLKKFQDRYSSFISNFRAAIAEKDKDTAARLLHTLKGVAGTIGAMRVQEAALNLEKVAGGPGHDGNPTLGTVEDYPEELIKVVDNELKNALSDLGCQVEDSFEKVSDNKSIDCPIELLHKFEQVLANSDSEASSLLTEISKTNFFINKELEYKELCKAVNEYDFSIAASIFSKIKNY